MSQDGNEKSLARGEWIAASRFHDLSELEVLREVAKRVSDLRKSTSAHPLVLLDLDSTLYEVGPRSFQILADWVKAEESAAFPAARAALARLDLSHVGYSLRDTFAAIGIANESSGRSALDAAKKFWSRRFFSNDYLPFDRPYPGAADFTREIHQLGAEIVYLTGRDEPNMGVGTRANLLRDGFPWEVERTHLLLKTSPQIPDLEHKKEAATYIRKHGTLVASFENEPKNLVALYEIFPQAMHVFVDTIYSDHEAVPMPGLYRIRGFR